MSSRSALSTVHAQQSVAATTQQGPMVRTVGSTRMVQSKPSSGAVGPDNAAKDTDAPSGGTDTRT
jgi:hypothetical protein